jgi:hypothetical protein
VNSGQDFFPVINFTALVFLNDKKRDFFHPFVSRVTAIAFGALASSANHSTVIRSSRINDFIVFGPTVRTFHPTTSINPAFGGIISERNSAVSS